MRGENGKMRIKEVRGGWYEVIERKGPDGYVLDEREMR
ncbi:SpaA isopeptide-forming pilin-related protein, partial [Bacillus pumilus]